MYQKMSTCGVWFTDLKCWYIAYRSSECVFVDSWIYPCVLSNEHWILLIVLSHLRLSKDIENCWLTHHKNDPRETSATA